MIVDFTVTYELVPVIEAGLTWSYFNETFTTARESEKLKSNIFKDMENYDYRFSNVKVLIYGKFRLFLLLFVRHLESFQRKNCAALLMLLGFKSASNSCLCQFQAK